MQILKVTIQKKWSLIALVSALIWSLFLKPNANDAYLMLESDESWVLGLSRQTCFNPATWSLGLIARPAHTLLYCLSSLAFNGLYATKIISWVMFVAVLFLFFFSLPKHIRGWAILLFALSPLAIFYSRVGLPELMIGVFLYIFVISFSKAIEKNSLKLAILAGACMGLAASLLIYQAFPFIILLVVYLVSGLSFWQGWKNLFTNILHGRPITLQSLPLISAIVASLVLMPFVLYVARSDPKQFVLMVLRDIGSHAPMFLTNVKYLWAILVFWLSIPITLLVVCGAIYIYQHDRKLFISLVAVSSFFLLRPVPRYWAQVVPLLAMIAAFGIYFLYQKNKRLTVVGLVLAFSILVWQAAISFENSRSDWYKQASLFLAGYCQQAKPKDWLFSNYWPRYWLLGTGNVQCAQHAAWLTTDMEDARIFSVSGVFIKAVDIAPYAPPLDILSETGGIVVVLTRPGMSWDSDTPARVEAIRVVEDKYRPIWQWKSATWLLPLSILPQEIRIYDVSP